MPSILGVIFDHDGTLVDSLPAVVAATNHALRDAGLPEDDPERIVSAMVLATVPRMGFHAGVSDVGEQQRLAREFYRHFKVYGPGYSALYPGIADLLVQLAHRGAAMGVVSNNHGDLIRDIMSKLGIGSHFRCSVGEEDMPAPKPDPRGLLRVISDLGLRPWQCVYVGDSRIDAQVARAAGVRAFGVTWGISPRDEMEAYGFDLLLDHPREILGAVMALDEETNLEG